jgi:hypothetical protein
MPLKIYDTIKPDGTFPIAEAADIEMPDGTRLSEFSAGAYPEVEGTSSLLPDKYYVFGKVSSLNLILIETTDDKAHEYCFEFIPGPDFSGLTISPEVKWAMPCVFLPNITHQVSVLRGVGVMIHA